MAKKKSVKQSKPEKITNNLDPHLQEVILRARAGVKIGPAFAQAVDDGPIVVDVIARLANPKESVNGLKVVRTIGRIVTGQIDVGDIEDVRKHANVLSLKRAKSLRRELEFSVSEINADPRDLSDTVGDSGIDGSGVIIGIVDYGCDFVHKNFRTSTGETRLLFFWDQDGGPTPISPVGFGYGREFDSTAINNALQATNPYTKLKHDPGKGTHGTHVMDIACGNGNGTGNPGVAPNASIIFVNIPADGIEVEDDVSDDETFNLGNSKMLLEAVDYIFEKADQLGMPAVVNISLSAQGGPHDGSTLVEQALDELLGEPGRAITIAAGNSYSYPLQNGELNLATHASGKVSDNSPRQMSFHVASDDTTNNEIEVWYPSGKELRVSLATPTGHKLDPVKLGTTVTLEDGDGYAGRIIHRKNDPNNGDNHIDIILSPRLPKGEWTISLETDSPSNIEFHSWIELDPFGKQAKFSDADNDATHTIGSISCGKQTIAVGSYLSGVPELEISPFSASGPTRDGRQKPEVIAPGQFLNPFKSKGILAARSKTQGATRISGTSMASPHVAGLIALLMQSVNDPLTVSEIRSAVVNAVRKNPSGVDVWHPRCGFGRVDTKATIKQLVPSVRSPLSAAANGATPLADSMAIQPLSIDSLLKSAASASRESGTKIKIEIEFEPPR